MTKVRAVRILAVLLPVLALSGVGAGTAAQTRDEGFTVGHYDLEVVLEPEVNLIRSRAEMRLVSSQPLASATLYLNRNLRVTGVTDAEGRNLTFEQIPRSPSFTVQLAAPIPADETFTLKVESSGAFDPALVEEGDAVLAMITPEAGYLLPESRWFPQGANAWQRTTMKLTVIAPEDLSVISSGEAGTPGAASQGKRRHMFTTTSPSFGGTVVYGKYDIARSEEVVPVDYHLRTVPSTYASTNAARVGDILSFYASEFGAPGNPKVSIVEIPDDSLEAYSAPGLLLLPVRHWSGEMSYRMLARQLAAQWWRVNVAPASDADVWLADGLGRYSEALYAGHADGDDGFRQALEDMTIGALVDESAAAIGNADRLTPRTPEHISVVRDKGAMVFHMLRQVLGAERFGELLRKYFERFAGQAASIDQFERFAEQVSGEPLDYFFGQWIRSTGIPQFDLEYVIFRTREGFRVNGAIKNTLEIFRMPVEIEVDTEGPPHRQVVEVAGSSSDFEFETFGKPLPPIRIDPDYNVLKYTPDLQLRVAIARGEAMFERGDYFEAIREYQEAVKIKRDSSLAHYRIGETFFHQRNYQSAANSFREAANGDRDPTWTLVWSHINLGKIFDITGQRERAVNEYRRALDTKDNTSGALEEARQYLQDPYRRESREIERIQKMEQQPVVPDAADDTPNQDGEPVESEKEGEKPPSPPPPLPRR